MYVLRINKIEKTKELNRLVDLLSIEKQLNDLVERRPMVQPKQTWKPQARKYPSTSVGSGSANATGACGKSTTYRWQSLTRGSPKTMKPRPRRWSGGYEPSRS